MKEREGRSYKGERGTRRGEVLGKDSGIQNIGSRTMRQRPLRQCEMRQWTIGQYRYKVIKSDDIMR